MTLLLWGQEALGLAYFVVEALPNGRKRSEPEVPWRQMTQTRVCVCEKERERGIGAVFDPYMNLKFFFSSEYLQDNSIFYFIFIYFFIYF